MSISGLKGKSQTVLGPVAAQDLGITLVHEHLVADLSVYFVEPANASEKEVVHRPMSLENVGCLHYDPWKILDNLRLRDEEVTIREVLKHKEAGGSTIVDLTNIGLGRDPQALKRIAMRTGLNVIMGSGYYIGSSHPPGLTAMTVDEIAEGIVRDIAVGVGDTGVRAGIIGEIGCSYPLQDGERRVLKAAALAQLETGAPVNIHPGFPYEASPFEITEVLAEADGNLNKTVISHIDILFISMENICKLARTGCYIEYDLFGRLGRAAHPVEFVDIPSEGQRVDAIKELIKNGFLNQILVSHDICYKMRLKSYGGHGYAHILNYVVPLMRAKGLSDEHIQTILVDNPKRLLQFV